MRKLIGKILRQLKRRLSKAGLGKSNPPAKTRIDFVVAGTQRGGTGALFRYLGQHPGIRLARKKEVHYFDSEKRFENKPNYSAYHAHFNLSDAGYAIGELTPIYMYWLESPRRMSEYNPELKIILVLRNPIDRAFSHWNMERHRKRDDMEFMDALVNEKKRCQEASPLQHRVYSYVDRGFYSAQIKRLWQYFPKDQVLILKNEQLKDNLDQSMSEIADFLGIAPFGDYEEKILHRRPYTRKITEEERNYLRSVFEDEIRELEKLLGWDCSDWLS